ncbi:50S ribosomal protein L34e [Candidatus Woesearchaeota archaeon]|nr:50S ribosomal protein L34e [Candidatus Woesearchaeota archaeon]
MRPSKQKSRTFRRVYVRTPGNRLVIHYKKRNPGKAKCRVCKNELHGIPRLRPFKMKNLSKTKKRPERPYGGNLCSKCMRKLIISKIR